MIILYVVINIWYELFDDLCVCWVIVMGFNKLFYLKIVFGDQVCLVIGFYLLMLFGYDDSICDWFYDFEWVKVLLKEVGVILDIFLNFYISIGSGFGGNLV